MSSTKHLGADSLARLNAKPDAPPQIGAAGLHHLRMRRKREALLYVPLRACEGDPALAVMLHGAGGNAQHGLDLLRAYADEASLILLAPESQKETWDIIVDSEYGPDVSFIDECLQQVFSQYRVDPTRVALGGFSDGASYALSLGLSNGELFRYILAFSPGFMAPIRMEGSPYLFLSHGTRDQVLPVDPCSRHLVRVLRNRNVAFEYREFDGPHTVPPEIRQYAVRLVNLGKQRMANQPQAST